MLLYFFSTRDVELIPIVLQGGKVYSYFLSPVADVLCHKIIDNDNINNDKSVADTILFQALHVHYHI